MFLLSLFENTLCEKKYPSFPVRMKNSSSFEKNLLYFCNCCILLILKSYYLLLHEKEKKTNMIDEWWMIESVQILNKSWNTGFEYNQLFSLHLLFTNYISFLMDASMLMK